ncbi:MAG: hypothetical protein J6F30_13125 [Cellulosilyticum sp.]|nr:hypothetical protein [Cellulosilyticum sp.]
MKHVKIKDARINHTALFTTANLLDCIREGIQGTTIDEFGRWSNHNGYSKQQVRDMVRIARMQLQTFSNELDNTYDWVE